MKLKLIEALVILLLIPALCFGQPMVKPKMSATKMLNETEKVEVYQYLRSGGGQIFVEQTPAKNDYIDSEHRGTVHYNPKTGYNSFTKEINLESRNYARHKVIIPDGTKDIKEVNFSQAEPHTVAITGKNLTFIKCNLTNVEIDPTWTLIDCNTGQVKTTIVEENGKTYEVFEVEKYGQKNVFKETKREDITDRIDSM